MFRYKWLSQIYKKNPKRGFVQISISTKISSQPSATIPFSVFVGATWSRNFHPQKQRSIRRIKRPRTSPIRTHGRGVRFLVGWAQTAEIEDLDHSSSHCGLPIFSNPNNKKSSKSECLSLWPNKCGTAIFPDFPIFSGSKNGPNFQQNLHLFRPGSGLFEVKRSEMWNENGGVTVAFDTAWWWNVPTPPGTCSSWLTGTRNQMLEIYLGRSFQNSKKNWKVLGSRIHIFVAKIISKIGIRFRIRCYSSIVTLWWGLWNPRDLRFRRLCWIVNGKHGTKNNLQILIVIHCYRINSADCLSWVHQ